MYYTNINLCFLKIEVAKLNVQGILLSLYRKFPHTYTGIFVLLLNETSIIQFCNLFQKFPFENLMLIHLQCWYITKINTYLSERTFFKCLNNISLRGYSGVYLTSYILLNIFCSQIITNLHVAALLDIPLLLVPYLLLYPRSWLGQSAPMSSDSGWLWPIGCPGKRCLSPCKVTSS